MVYKYNKKKVLCLGNNTEDTDVLTRKLAADSGSQYHGLLSELEMPVESDMIQPTGFYHSSVYDIQFGRLIKLCNAFNLVIMLPQPIEKWSHPDAFYNTIKILQSIKTPTEFLDPTFPDSVNYFKRLVASNSSFCAFPFIELLVDHGNTTVCCRSSQNITPIDKLQNYGKDPNYQFIRQKMLAGHRLPEHCNHCYNLEDLGIVSARQQETVEWANRLGFNTVEDFRTVSTPFYYEVRPSNRCNLRCRMCRPKDSHLIDKEYRMLGIIDDKHEPAKKVGGGFEIVDFQNLRKLYLAGGEPLVMPETYNFLSRCIQEGRTDFEFVINTNGTKLSKKLQRAFSHFSNLQFIFSIDAYQDLNRYIRWPSDWNSIMQNWHALRNSGHKVMINTTVSIYNIHRLHELYQFIDTEFPGTLTHCEIVQGPTHLSPWLFPYRDLVLRSLEASIMTDCAANDTLFADHLNAFIRIVKDLGEVDHGKLLEFYRFNDLLDRNRGVHLADYLPELESFRSVVK